MEDAKSVSGKEIIAEKLHWKAVYLLKGYINSSLRGQSLFEKVDAIVSKRFSKALRAMDYEKLRLVLSVIQNRW